MPRCLIRIIIKCYRIIFSKNFEIRWKTLKNHKNDRVTKSRRYKKKNKLHEIERERGKGVGEGERESREMEKTKWKRITNREQTFKKSEMELWR